MIAAKPSTVNRALCKLASVYVPGMTRDEFIAAHVRVCCCPQVRYYDRRKPKGALHSLAYSRRKCAKKLWRRHQAKSLPSTGATNG